MQARDSPLSRRTSEPTPPRSKRGAVAGPASRRPDLARVVHAGGRAVPLLRADAGAGTSAASFLDGDRPDSIGDLPIAPSSALGDRPRRERPRCTGDAPRLGAPHG